MDVTGLKKGQKALITEILGGFGMTRRLEAMGIRPGVEVFRVGGHYLKGPVIVRVGSTEVAIGYGMARRIIVEELK